MQSPDIGQEGRTFVIFRLGAEEYGLAIERVQSIIRFEQATPVPRAPESVMGVINLRGQVIPVVDLVRRLSGGGFVPGPASRIVVTEGEAGTVGLAVDAANEVVSLAAAEIRPAPEGALGPETAEMFEGVVERDGRLVILLDFDKAVPRSEYARATETEAEGGSDA